MNDVDRSINGFRIVVSQTATNFVGAGLFENLSTPERGGISSIISSCTLFFRSNCLLPFGVDGPRLNLRWSKRLAEATLWRFTLRRAQRPTSRHIICIRNLALGWRKATFAGLRKKVRIVPTPELVTYHSELFVRRCELAFRIFVSRVHLFSLQLIVCVNGHEH